MWQAIRRWLRPQRLSVPETVRQRFRHVATDPAHETRRIGRTVALELGYDAEEITVFPSSIVESFAGVGNPLSLGELRPGETVLDLGSGAGVDSILAARRVGATGRVLGIDFTLEMVKKARDNVALLGLTNIAFLPASVEALPFPDATAEVALCNGLFNLCPDKPRALAEVFRVLQPGGRFLIADVLLEEHVTPEEVARRGQWAE